MISNYLRSSFKSLQTFNKFAFSVKVGDHLPQGVLTEFVQDQGPQAHEVKELIAGKNLAIFAVPGAFTPTCSAKHVPGFLENYSDLKQSGIDEIWCISVNDPFVMGAWAKDQKTDGKIRLLADGSATYTQELGQVFDLTQKGLGIRSQRYSMLVKDGQILTLNVDAPGKFEISDAQTLLKQAKNNL